MARRLFLGSLWVGFVFYAFLFAPPNQPDTLSLITRLSTGQWDGINPLIVALFNLMGVLPLLYGCVMLLDGRGQKRPAWLFVATSLGVGAFALLPYLALRQANQTFIGEKNGLLKLADSRWSGGAIALAGLAFLAFGLLQGDWSDFINQWQTSRFIHVMSLDFVLLCVLFPTLLGDDMARRGLEQPWLFWGVSLCPLVGPLLYLMLRPPIQLQGSSPQQGAGPEAGVSH